MGEAPYRVFRSGLLEVSALWTDLSSARSVYPTNHIVVIRSGERDRSACREMWRYVASMRQSDVDHVRQVVERVVAEDESLSRSDYVALLILIRDIAPPASLLKDLSHNIAHDARNRGYAFDQLKSLVGQLQSALERRVARPDIPMLFPVETVIDELNTVLPLLGITARLDVDSLSVRRRFAAGIAQSVAATTYSFDDGSAMLGINPEGEYLVLIWLANMPRELSPKPLLATPWLHERGGAAFRRQG